MAVADQHRLPHPVGVPFSDNANEMDLRATNILDRLPWLRIGRKSDEIGGMARAQRDADFAVVLHAADTRPVTRPGVKYDEWSFGRIGFDARRRANSDERIIHRSLEPPPVDDQLRFKVEDVRRLAFALFAIIVTPRAQHVEKEHGALERVAPIVEKRVRRGKVLGHSQAPNRTTLRARTPDVLFKFFAPL